MPVLGLTLNHVSRKFPVVKINRSGNFCQSLNPEDDDDDILINDIIVIEFDTRFIFNADERSEHCHIVAVRLCQQPIPKQGSKIVLHEIHAFVEHGPSPGSSVCCSNITV